MKRVILLLSFVACYFVCTAQNIKRSYNLDNKQSDYSVFVADAIDSCPGFLFLVLDTTAWNDYLQLMPNKIEINNSNLIQFNSQNEKVEYKIVSIDNKNNNIVIKHDSIKDTLKFRTNNSKTELVWHGLVYK